MKFLFDSGCQVVAFMKSARAILMSNFVGGADLGDPPPARVTA